ncbi:MAG: type IV pilus modification protein PilV [Gammaproteobacteria bacterium]|nr:type IV pilus modification protein PilV [Gammaproteobacteria bacterium]
MKTHQQAGFSLVETLITILVVSIGLLGFAALQINALNSSIDTFSRNQAVIILEDAVARIRNNRDYTNTDKLQANAYTNDSSDFYTWCDIEKNTIPVASCKSGEACSFSKLAKEDIYQICQTLVSTKLPNAIIGSKCFDRDSSDADSCSVGSRMSLYMAWKGFNRKDVSGKENYSQNTRCQTEVGLASDYACVQLELVQ